MLIRPLLAVFVALGLVAPAFAASAPRAVVELFTSQGCSESPKADAMLEDLTRRGDVLTLAYHVDYWDYIGWPDNFGRREFTERQRQYAASFGSTKLFTPQMVVNGQEGIVGSHEADVEQSLEGASLPLAVALVPEGDVLGISIPANPAMGRATVWLVTYLDHADVEITAGMNKGKQLAYTQIVTGRQMLGTWNPASGLAMSVPLAELKLDGKGGAVVLVQQERKGLPGPILGAALVPR
jgi:hypothetical protein